VDEVLGDLPYDLVHINYGLEALHAAEPQSLQDYRATVRALVDHVAQQGARIIWATTTPIPEEAAGYVRGGAARFNAAVKGFVNDRRCFLNDLHSYVALRDTDMMRPGGVEMTPAGNALLGSVVAGRIAEVLAEGEDPDLPYVLLLGDSIANGYNTAVRELLKGVANVRWGGSGFGPNVNWDALVEREVRAPSRAIGRPFAVIHVNWGLHALKFVDAGNRLATPTSGTRCVALEDYPGQVDGLLNKLRQTGDEIIWATTTPEHGASWAMDGDVARYNKAALPVLARHGVQINDLETYVREQNVAQRRSDCHFTAEGSAQLGRAVAASIKVALQRQKREHKQAAP
jgi:hypothetical protein